MALICIDAGHAGSPVHGSGYSETAFNWQFSRILGSELLARGVQVRYNRRDCEVDMDLIPRGEVSRGCDLFISIHSNWNKNPAVDHPLAIPQLDGRLDSLARDLADTVHVCMVTNEPGRIWHREHDRKPGVEWYGVLRGAANVGTPGLILEHSFYTCPKMADWMKVSANLQHMAEREADVIAHYLGAGVRPDTVKRWSVGMPYLRRGSTGVAVQLIQAALVSRGYGCGSEFGTYGERTEAAVRRYQEDIGVTVDGIVGHDTGAPLLGGV